MLRLASERYHLANPGRTPISTKPRWTFAVLYDEQCEICQAGAAWLRALDRHGQVACIHYLSSPHLESDARLSHDSCARELHVVRSDGTLWVGASAVRELARQFKPTRWLGKLLEIQPLRFASDRLYAFVARNRYQLSKCRGGACRTTLTRPAVPTTLSAFWSCYTLGFILRLPLIAYAIATTLIHNAKTYVANRNRSYTFLNGRLTVFFLGGFPFGLVPFLFGEQFWMVLFDGILVDPGGSRMVSQVRKHLSRLPRGAVKALVATHAHEEHIGNLALASRLTQSPIHATLACGESIRHPARIPFMRRLIIGQPQPYSGEWLELDDTLQSTRGSLRILPAPGHSDVHVVLLDTQSGVLLAGDAFMGAYFSSPNADVDSDRWLSTLSALQEFDIKVLITGHGQIFTLDPAIPDLPGVVFRVDPKQCLAEKRAFLEWVRGQIVSGTQDGLPVKAIEATLFPWNRPWSWENFFSDELARLLSRGEFSRSQFVRSFDAKARPGDPLVYQASCWTPSPNHR